jgi:hypothetical protein
VASTPKPTVAATTFNDNAGLSSFDIPEEKMSSTTIYGISIGASVFVLGVIIFAAYRYRAMCPTSGKYMNDHHIHPLRSREKTTSRQDLLLALKRRDRDYVEYDESTGHYFTFDDYP